MAHPSPLAMTNQTVSHYRCLEPIGSGGMGVVYKAEDIRLSRAVALKFLPADRVSAPQAVERFLREARAASALNHPNICTIYEVDEFEGSHFIAMELLQGKTIDRLLDGKPLDIGTVLDLGIQIADALDAAHAHGILHRDIKPANLFVTTRGQVKILDFGLAKLGPGTTDGSAALADVTNAPTAVLTTVGTSLGTVAYMSPEQACGEELDSRTDLFSFGLVLYEMATGQRTFTGTTTALIFDAILNREPKAPMELNANVPAELERVIAKALEKDRRMRYQTAADLRADLQRVKRERDSGRMASRTGGLPAVSAPSGASWPSATRTTVASAVAPPESVPTRPGSRMVLMAAAGVALVVAGGAVASFWMRSSAAPPSPATEVSASAAAAGAAPDTTAGSTSTPVDAAPGASSTVATASPDAARPGTGAPTRPAAAPAGAAPTSSAPTSAATAPSDDLQVARAKFDVGLFDQALADLRAIVSRTPPPASAAPAYLLMASIQERQNRTDDAAATYVELRSKFPTAPAAVEGTFRMAGLMLRSRRSDRDTVARELYTEIVSRFPESTWAPQALVARAGIEERAKIRLFDSVLQTSVPAALVSYRSLVDTYPNDPGVEAALAKLAGMYNDTRRYALAAETYDTLAVRFPDNGRDAAWQAGEIYEERVRDMEKARTAYARVPPGSSRYRDAQRRMQR